ncbi:MAG: 23S rRNA (guanosine(2251)-2'-O)-methyltransferase RlmB [Candidatus Rokubacteria bacterium]|nr:23S rRNA (guanosine(2251)-2'-O)-methyltransferase RlmB [Candidatus Rokubacteria bacterium]
MQEISGLHPVREALLARRRRLYCLRVRGEDRRPALVELAALAAGAGVPVEEVDAAELARRAGPEVAHQGAVLSAGPLPEVPLAALACRGDPPRTLVALDGVEDPQNLGAVARAAEASGAAGLVLTRHRAPPLGPAAARASAGAIEWLPVTRVVNLSRALRELKRLGFWVFGTSPEAPDDLFRLEPRVVRGDRVVVLGAEGRGIRAGVDRLVDHRVRIPMSGRVASLNVSAAAAVVLFELARAARSEGG